VTVSIVNVTANKTNPTICENVWFTATTNPVGYEQHVTWTAVGGEPGSGGPNATFTTHWPCIGGKAAEAHLGASHYAKGVTVVLPANCEEGSASASITADWVLGCPAMNCEAGAPGAHGCTDIDPNFLDNPTGPVRPVYQGCAWVWQVDRVFHKAYGTCPNNFTDICGPGDIDPNDRTEAYVTSAIQALFAGGGTADCGACVWVHEGIHKDAYDVALAEGAQGFVTTPLPIDCADPNTTTAQGLLNSPQRGAIVDEIYRIGDLAEQAQQSVESEATATGKACKADAACELCYYAASQQGWDLPDDCYSKCSW
jgi:hypothetical protein